MPGHRPGPDPAGGPHPGAGGGRGRGGPGHAGPRGPDPAGLSAGRGRGAPGAAPAARSPQCGGWLGALLGQCCLHQPEVVEVDLRESPAAWPEQRGQGAADHALVETPEPFLHSSSTRPASRQVGGALPEPGRGDTAQRMTGGAAAGPAAGPRSAASGVLGPGEVMGTFLVDNSILKIEGPPGVAYRYTKARTDKVRSDVAANVAKWGDILQGVDEGDGWLRVGQFYLPMTHDKVPVITPLQGAPAGAALHRGGATQPRRSPAAPTNNAPAAPGATAATAPGARNGGEAARTVTPTPPPAPPRDTAPAGAAPAPPTHKKSPAPAPTPAPTGPAPVAEAAVVYLVVPGAEAERATQDNKVARGGAPEPKPATTRAAAFPLMPSVGSWLLPLPQPWPPQPAPQAPEGRFELLPSVGTWYFRRPSPLPRPPTDEKKLLSDGDAQVGLKDGKDAVPMDSTADAKA